MKTIFFKFIIIILLLVSPIFYVKRSFKHVYLSQHHDEYVNVTMENGVQKILLDDYLLGVVAGEMPASYEIEAIKAQVVASRTFVYSRLLNVDCTTNTQVYLTQSQMKESWKNQYDLYVNKIKKAIQDTKGQIITYDKKCISALFFNSCDGKTENIENYFAGDSRPYLVSVSSPWDKQYDLHYQTRKYYTLNQLNQYFTSFTHPQIIYYPSGYVKTLTVDSKTYTGRQVREILNLRSSAFKLMTYKQGYMFITTGSGHGVGMSQCGAQGMAKEGKSYKEIIQHYYQGVEITKNKE